MNNNTDTEDVIKKISAELSLDKPSIYHTDKSTKQIIKNIYDEILYIKNDIKYKEKKTKWNSDSALNFLAISALFIFLLSTRKATESTIFLENIKLYAYILSIALSAIWIGINLERTNLFKEIWRFGITKLTISLFFTTLVIFSTATASSVINNIFGIDSSFFPFTRSLLTAYIFFKYASILIYILLIISLLNIIPIYNYFKHRKDLENNFKFPKNSIILIILTLLFSYFAWGWSTNNLDTNTLNNKVYLLAHQLDFNNKNLCTNLKGEDVSVIFLQQNKVLVDYNTTKIENIYSFINELNEDNYDNIKVISCDY